MNVVLSMKGNNLMQKEIAIPSAYFITFTCYGRWSPRSPWKRRKNRALSLVVFPHKNLYLVADGILVL